jgi:hypothetical protein
MDSTPNIKGIYNKLGRLCFNTLIYKLQHINDIFLRLTDEQKIVVLRFIQSDLNFLLWVIATPTQVEEVRTLERENVHLRYSLYYHAGST